MKRMFVIMAAGLFGIMACAPGKEYFEKGNEFRAQQKFEMAIQFYEKALKEEPDNVEYRNALNKTRKDFATLQYDTLVRQYNETSKFTVRVLSEFKSKAEAIRAISSEVPPLNEFIKIVTSRHDSMKREATQAYENALDYLGKNMVFEAVMDLKKVVAIDPDNHDARSKLDQYIGPTLKALYDEGARHMKALSWKEAINAFQKASQIDPTYHDVGELLKRCKQNDNAQFFVNEGEKAIASDRWADALAHYNRAVEYEPQNKDLLQRRDFVREKYALLKIKNAEKAFLQGKVGESAMELRDCLQIDPNAKKGLFARTLMQKVYQIGTHYEAKKQWGNAFIWYNLLRDIEPEYQDLFFRIQKVQDELNKRIITQLAVLDFRSPKEDPDAGPRVSNSLISYLFQNSKPDMRIVERDALQSILKEFQLEQAGIVDLKAAKQIGKISGIKILVIGNVLVADVKEQKFSERKKKKVVTGQRSVPNPAYSTYIMANVGKMDDEKVRRMAPPPTIYEEVSQILEYEEGTVTRTGYLDVAVRIIDMENGEILGTKTIKSKVPVSDRYSEGLELANVPRDPLELPDMTEVFKKTLDQAVTELAQFILSHFDRMEMKYFSKAEELLRRRNYTEAIEFYMDSITDAKRKKEDESIVKEAEKVIAAIMKAYTFE